MSEPPAALESPDGALLARLASTAVAARLTGCPLPVEAPDHPVLRAPGASFVTLECGARLRGCVGSLDPARPLWRDAMRNAVRAMSDPRMPAVTATDWPDLDVKVTVLGPLEPVPVADASALLAALRPGVHGLFLTEGTRRATFLPAVWHKLPEPTAFLAALLVKGGWPAGYWSPRLNACRYTAQEFRDTAPREPLP
jgi:AmmeMemoRadiSam system protein A